MLYRQDTKTQRSAKISKQEFERLGKEIFLASLEVHKLLGPCLLESVYEFALIKELELREILVSRQVKLPLYYKQYNTKKEFYIDLLVENEIIIEIKAVEQLHPIHEAQLISYLKLANKRLGFLINFNVPLLKNGFKRRVNNY